MLYGLPSLCISAVLDCFFLIWYANEDSLSIYVPVHDYVISKNMTFKCIILTGKL